MSDVEASVLRAAGAWRTKLARASQVWRDWCAALERTGVAALEQTLTHDEIDLAEGLRHLARMARLTLLTNMENDDAAHPYLHRSLGPTLKMGGDNPCGLYLSAPVNGTDTYRLTGTRGSASWVSFMAQRSHECFAHGLGVFGDAIFMTGLQVASDGTFEMILSPQEHAGNWIETDRFTSVLIIRQFFGGCDDVRPMDLTIENLTRGGEIKSTLSLDAAAAGLARSAQSFGIFLPAMQSEMQSKAGSVNAFDTDVGDPTSNFGGVPGGNAVTTRWRLEADEALVVHALPPTPCPYWDVQVGNLWYESWDYRHFFSGLSGAQASLHDDGSVTIVVSERDPGTCNWLETAGHREGHMAIRWQLTEGKLPLPDCKVVKVDEVAAVTGLPAVTTNERRAQRRAQRAGVEKRFRL
jgi:hypothetical protein